MATNRLELPLIVKPKHGSGGFHSRVLRTESDIARYILHQEFTDKEPVLVQELIHGIDASVSILATGTKAIALSINEQLIGLSDLGKGNTKAYCGNIVPLKAKSKILDKLRGVSEEMSVKLGLVGSNGFDFVIDKKGIPYFMEINPRIQATIEAIELVSNVNVVTLHLDACNGQLPKRPLKPRAFCARIIVYARFPCIISNLSSIPGIVDIPMPNSRADRGDPVCTVNHLAASRKDALAGAWSIVNTIYQNLQPVSSSNKEDLK
jgi:predicted ATP-grasp superfamily ATP-dependent carboligase